MERTGGLIINRGFFRVGLTGIRIVKYDVALNILGEANHGVLTVKLGVKPVSEAYVGRFTKSRKVRVRLVKRYAQHAVRGQIISCIDLVGPALVYDIYLQRAGLFFGDNQTFGYLVCKGGVVGELTRRILGK